MESTNLSKAKPFYIPELHFSKTKLKGKKKRKRPTWLLFTETEKVVQNSPWREAEWHMCGKAGCLCAWIQTGPGTGSRPEHKTKPYCHRPATQPTALTQQFWEASENIPLFPFAAFPIWFSHLPTTGKDSSPLCPERTLYAPCRARKARQEPRGQLYCLDGFLAKERGNPKDRGAWWATVQGVEKSFGQDWASEHEQQAVPTLRSKVHLSAHQSNPQEARGQRAAGAAESGGWKPRLSYKHRAWVACTWERPE